VVGIYVRRWYIETPWFTIRLHHWLRSDDKRAFHDHPWSFLTIILRGSYVDVSPECREMMSAGKIAFRRSTHQHYVETSGCWSILFTGPKTRKWGFFPNGKAEKDSLWQDVWLVPARNLFDAVLKGRRKLAKDLGKGYELVSVEKIDAKWLA
jgi:hypothetical protein